MKVDERVSAQAWSRLLAAKGIDLSSAKFPVPLSHKELGQLGKLDARLMMSMDERTKWPAPLRDHDVFPISTSARTLVLVKGDAWFDFPPAPTPPKEFKGRLPFELVSQMLGKGENGHILRLETSGFLREFLGAQALVAVDYGKRMAPAFDLYVRGQLVHVDGTQYEMDAQYESRSELVPVEAKTHQHSSCAIKQVYFPFRGLGESTNWRKPVRPLFISYSKKMNDYVVRELGFRRKEIWESIYVVKAAAVKLRLEKPPARLLDLGIAKLDSNRIPQADAAWRIEQFPLAVYTGKNSAATIAEFFEFHERQSYYYRDAAAMLGLVFTDDHATFRLTPAGQNFVQMSPQGRSDEVARLMCRLPAMNAVLEEVERSGDKGLVLSRLPEIIQNHAAHSKEPCNATTAKRRALTIRAWLKYIGSRTGAVVLSGSRFYLREDVPNLDRFIESAS